MDNLIDVRGFNPNDESHLAQLEMELDKGYKFDNLTDLCSIARLLVANNSNKAQYLYNKIINEKVMSNSSKLIVDTKNRCPVCGSPIVYDDDDVNMADSCLICDYCEDIHLTWEELREGSHKVLIWNAHFRNNSVCNITELTSILEQLKLENYPDKLRYRGKTSYSFVDKFMNDTVVNHRMSEYEKFENTCLMIIHNSSDENARELAQSILNELSKLDKKEFTKDEKAEPAKLAKMNLGL